MKVKVKLTFRSNDKTINTIATNSKEMGQLITESLRKEKQALSDNKKIQKSEKKNLTLNILEKHYQYKKASAMATPQS